MDRNLVKMLGLWAAFGIAMCLLPFLVDLGIMGRGTIRIFVFANYVAIFAMSWDIVSGRTGYISFGHPFLIGIGGYTTAMLTYHLDMSLFLSIPLAVLATMLFGGTLFFLPALRTRGTYFALVTLAFMELFYQLTQVLRPDITGGTRGISGIPAIVRGAVPNYYLSFALMFVIAISLWFLVRTRLGTALSAIRMDEDAVKSCGLSTAKLKYFAIMVSSLVAGVGGAFYIHYLGSIAPRGLFEISFLFTILVAALLGGAGTIIGPVMGAYFLTFLLEYLRPWIAGTERYFYYGVIALLVFVVAPNGLHGVFGELRGFAGRLRRPQAGSGSGP